jgi:D-alanine-D-alanine ligase-like ATP-grasp enzyme
MYRLKVGIVFGGCSEEHPISVKSAQEVAQHLDVKKYEPFYIGITKRGAWKLCDSGPDVQWENGRCRPAVLSPDRSVRGLLVLEQGRYETISWNDLDLLTGEVDRISLSHGFFRIHQEIEPESGSENSTPIVPADISPEARSRVQKTAKALYRALGCSGLARVDMFLKEDGAVVLNEVNTLPGMTSYSRYPRMMPAAGLPLAEVIDRIVSLALIAGRR